MIKIFNATDTDFSTNGNIVINPIKCLEIKKKSLNGWYLDVEVPIKYANYIEQDKLCVVQTKSKINPQAFRIENPIKTTRKIKFHAHHVMFDAENYFLLDVRPTEQSGAGALSYINSRTDKTSPFSIYSNVTHTDTAYFIRKSLLEAWEIIEERWGGTFDADNWNISFVNSVGHDNSEVISYKNNLQGIEIFEDWSNVCTKICPVGYDGIMLPEIYLSADVQYEKPYTRKVEITTDLEDEEKTEENLIAELRNKAQNYLNENKYPKISYEITSNIKQTLSIGDTIHIKHPLVNLQTEVIEYEYDIISKKVKRIVFGNYDRNVMTKINNIKQTLNNVKETLSTQEVVIQKQTNIINTLNKNGYVYIDDNEILILDRLPKEQARNVWRWGLGGLGFSSNGYEGPFETAITMDGQINANFITTGQLEVSVIRGLSDTLSQYSTQINLNKDNITSIVSKQDEFEDDLADRPTTTNVQNMITQKADELDVKISRKIGSSEVVTSLNASADKLSLSTGRLEVNSNNNGIYDYNKYDAYIAISIARQWLEVSSSLEAILDYDGNNETDIFDVNNILSILNGTKTNTKQITGTFKIDTQKPKDCISITKDGEKIVSIGTGGVNTEMLTTENIICGYFSSLSGNYFTGIVFSGRDGTIRIIKNGSAKTVITPTDITIDTGNTINCYRNINMHNYTISNVTFSSPSISNASMSGTSISDSSITNSTLKGSVTINSGSALDCNRDIDMNGKDISDCTLRGGYRPIVNYSKSATVDSFNFANGSSTYLELITLYSGTYGITLWSSDARLKENIEDTEINALDVINKIKHRKFKWKDKDVHEELGYIAQEIEQVKENFVLKVPQRDKEGNIVDETYQINETKIIPYLSKAIQELSEENTKLKSIIDKQQSMIDFLFKKLNLNFKEGI